MAEVDDRRQAQAAETPEPPQASAAETDGARQAPSVEEHSDVSRAMAGAVVVLLLLVPGAFLAGWRLGRMVGRLRGF